MGKSRKSRKNSGSESNLSARKDTTMISKKRSRSSSGVDINTNLSSQQILQTVVNERGMGADKSVVGSPMVPNPLLNEQASYLSSLTTLEREHFFSEIHVSPERRATIWMDQADLGENLVNQYSWATPDLRCLRILKHFSPIIEIGCGSNAYWCRQMLNAGIDVIGFDTSPTEGGKISAPVKRPKNTPSFKVNHGGPDVLQNPKHKHRTLFLCYPDEQLLLNDDNEQTSMAYQCLKEYNGDHVIHVGELLLSGTTLAMDQAPWGRSSSPEFQQQLATDYHCILRFRLQNWLHTSDTITVWKRSQMTSIVYAADDKNDVDEEVQFRYIPPDEKLPIDAVAPCMKDIFEATILPESDSTEQLQCIKAQQSLQEEVLEGDGKPTRSTEIKQARKKPRSKTSKVERHLSETKPTSSKTVSHNKRKHQTTTSKDDAAAYTCPW